MIHPPFFPLGSKAVPDREAELVVREVKEIPFVEYPVFSHGDLNAMGKEAW